MSERESWEKELEALGRDSAAEGAEPVETAAGETETGAEQSFAEEAEEGARAAERDFERRLEKAIDRRIRSICLKTIAVVAAVCTVVFLVVSPVVGLFFPSPQRVGGMSSASLEEYLGAYYETTRPYVELVPASDQAPQMDAEPRLRVLYCGAERTGYETVLGENRRKQREGHAELGALCSEKRPGECVGPKLERFQLPRQRGGGACRSGRPAAHQLWLHQRSRQRAGQH